MGGGLREIGSGIASIFGFEEGSGMFEESLEDSLTGCGGVIMRREKGWKLGSVPVWTRIERLIVLLLV